MRVVIYDDDMEPLTVVNIPSWGVDVMKENRLFRIPVLLPVTVEETFPETMKPTTIEVVNIKVEIFARNGKEHLMAFTDDTESALLLKSVFLPGQQRQVNEIAQHNFVKGLIAALEV